MKTRDAFAFRDFDATRILQRPFFREWREKYHVGDGNSDAEILATLTVTDSDAASAVEEKNAMLKAISDGLSDLCKKLERHANYQRGRLENYRRRLMKKNMSVAEPSTTQTLSFQARVAREQELLGFYTVTVLPSFTDITAYVAVLLTQSDKALQAVYRRRFGERLKAAREAAGMTQKEIAKKLNLSAAGFAFYERGERELTILTITRLSQILNISTDKLFGLK